MLTPFTSFRVSLKGDIVTPEHPDSYERSRSAQRKVQRKVQRKSQVVAFVRDEEDVALCIQYARENKLHSAIKGGGHRYLCKFVI